MIIKDLTGIWEIKGGKYEAEGKIPGSVYSILLENGLIDDPYYRDNELKTLSITDDEFVFRREFNFEKKNKKIVLVCEGIDTLCDLYMNGKKIAHTENMHRTYRIDVSSVIKDGKNEIKAVFPPLDAYIKRKKAENPLYEMSIPLSGFSHIRKASCMLGWDWGPRLPDAGIWRKIYLVEEDNPYIIDVRIIQRHENGKVYVTVTAELSKEGETKITLIAPDGSETTLKNAVEMEISNAEIWWLNGFGEQPLYSVKTEAIKDGKAVDVNVKRIGLRQLGIHREKDEYGESFSIRINGTDIFAMGAAYIPEDNILSRITEERSRKLLTACKNANYNTIRIWGGGYYVDDWFLDLCDEIGMAVLYDLMYSSACYNFDEGMKADVAAELEDNVKRLRHHACITLIYGNNEIAGTMYSKKDKNVDWYNRMFEEYIPSKLKELCPEIEYCASSPNSYGYVENPDDENYGDSHYWGVWHCDLLAKDFRQHNFRFLSEFGFQSIPDEKTVAEFCLPSDRNITGKIMDMRQKSRMGNSKLVNYLSRTHKYSSDFSTLIYATQILQADTVKYGVEHMRRNRGRSMGTLYWQLNDIWPGITWSSIDSRGRKKALYYESKRFFAGITVSCLETNEYDTKKDINDERNTEYATKAKLYVCNETLNETKGELIWQLRDNTSKVLESGTESITVPKQSVRSIDEIDFHKTDTENNYLWYEYRVDGKVVSSGSVIFTLPKYFNYANPELKAEIIGDEIEITAQAYAKSVEIRDETSDLTLSDNYFDMNAGTVRVKILSGEPSKIKLRSVFDIK